MSDFEKYAEEARAAIEVGRDPTIALVYALLALGGALDEIRREVGSGLNVRLEQE